VQQTSGLKNKPKLFVVQSCRNLDTDADQVQDSRPDVHYRNQQDCFYAYSVVEGCLSHRHPERGCLFAQALRDVLLDEDSDLRVDEFTSLFPAVTHRVAIETNDKQIACTKSTLRKLLYFPPLPSCPSWVS
uniref:CASPASE_P20 domain-containing protein n=1 Tax=Macrostomum lignano TaxID=282301 RepID=A0A1I8IF03_9PLAT